jgi:uncharacterized SAM-binding protein YcdF (DUF218 family)
MAAKSPRQSAPRKYYLWLSGAAALSVLGAIFLFLLSEPLLIASARALRIDDAKPPADYLVVLGGGPETRPFAAAALYRKGFASKVLIFEQKTDRINELGLTLVAHELYRKVLELEGVRSEAIHLLPGIADSSWAEARIVRRFLTVHPARRIILVTSAEHTRRARWVFKKVLDRTPVEVRMAAASHLGFDETNWWKDDEGALVYLHEFFKFPFYWIRYSWPGRSD